MSDIEKIENNLDAIASLILQVRNFTTKYDEYSTKQIISLAKFAMSLCPVQVGDRVCLNKTPEITDKVNWGWLGDKHFLVKGATGRVIDIGFSDFEEPHFLAVVSFDSASWIDPYTKVYHSFQPEKSPHFCFGVRWLDNLSNKTKTDTPSYW